MKSEFSLAFNQICANRGLPPEIVLDALKTALVSAYRRNTGISSAQNVIAEIEESTGQATIYVEKEVVESVQDERTEVSSKKAGTIDPEAKVGDLIMVESTPEDFGRIAAQTAKQVILQRIREAERDALYEDYIGREGEVINGTVQSITPQHISINLGRTEAILPRKEQVPGERYTMHQRLRAYVLEVKRTTRGPQIVVSRSHRNMLRRMLELEVPEIYNGVVEIKSIAREAGARSKVAVAATQPGVDPVGSCVGMRGVRIQSIVNELGGEKIDVIEWSPDAELFIAKALSPAKVMSVHLDENPEDGRTAVVIVPDDQLSLAIGREGQNARLAAKLTGWRIDIKGITEAANEMIAQWAELDLELGGLANLIPTAMAVLQRHAETEADYGTEELLLLRQIVDGIHKHLWEQRKAVLAIDAAELARQATLSAEAEKRQAERKAALADIPDAAYVISLEDMGLSGRVRRHLTKADIENVGQIMEHLVDGDEGLLALEGIGPKGLAEIKQQLDTLPLLAEEPTIDEPVDLPSEKVVEAAAELAEEAVEAPVSVDQMAVLEPAGLAQPQVGLEAAVQEEIELQAESVTASPEVAELEPEPTLISEEMIGEDERELAQEPDFVIYYDDDEEMEESYRGKSKRSKQKRRRLIYDEDLGRVVTERRRKRGRREGWDDFVD